MNFDEKQKGLASVPNYQELPKTWPNLFFPQVLIKLSFSISKLLTSHSTFLGAPAFQVPYFHWTYYIMLPWLPSLANIGYIFRKKIYLTCCNHTNLPLILQEKDQADFQSLTA